MKKTEFEFFIHKFDYILPVYSDNKNLINEQREQVMLCLEQVKIKMMDVIANLQVASDGFGSRDYDVCVHLVSYYNKALRVILDKEMSNDFIKNRVRQVYSESEAAKINSRFD